MISFTKTVDTNVDIEQNIDVDIELDEDISIDLNLDSNVDISGNFANLTFDATAVGDNSFVEGDASVFTSSNLSEISGTFVAAVDDFGRPILDDDDDDIIENIFESGSGNDGFEGTIDERDVVIYNTIPDGFGTDTIIGFETDLDEIRLGFDMTATLFTKDVSGAFLPVGEILVNDGIFFGEISGAFKIETGNVVELVFPAEGEIVFEKDEMGMDTDIPLAQITYGAPPDFEGGSIFIDPLVGGNLQPDNLVFLNE